MAFFPTRASAAAACSDSRSLSARFTQLPTVCRSTLMYSETVLPGRYVASHATVKSNSFVKPLPGSPWDIRHIHAVFRASDPVSLVFDFHKDSLCIQPSPCAGTSGMSVIHRARLMAERAVIPMPFVGACLDTDMLYAIRIRIKTAVFNNSVLDI